MTLITIAQAFRATRDETFYHNGQAKTAPAYRRLELARDNLDRYNARHWAWTCAARRVNLATPETLQEAQAQERKAIDALTRSRVVVCRKPRGAAYVGTWQAQAGLWYCENPESFFRSVVTAQDTGATDHSGWYDNDHGESSKDGSGLIWGIVAQLVGRDGKARFVPGYVVGDSCGAVFDMSQIFEGEGDDSDAAQRDCGMTADSMAESCADKEREYKAAWQAGQEWRDLQEQEAQTRRDTLELLAERRAARGMGAGFPVICERLRGMVQDGIDAIRESREKRESIWADIPTRLEPAFCEGADLDRNPA